MKKSVNCILIIIMVFFSGCHAYDLRSVSEKNDVGLISLGKYTGLEATIITHEITNKQIDDYIKVVVRSYEEMYEVTDRDIIESHDTIRIDYDVIFKDVKYGYFKDVQFMLDNNEMDAEFEKNLIGAKINTPIEFEMTVPESSQDPLAGCIVRISCVVKNIYAFHTVELNDDFVKKEFGQNSVNEYRVEVKNKLLEFEKIKSIDIAKSDLVNQIVTNSKFNIDENIILKNAETKVDNYIKMADIYGLSLEEYIEKILDISNEVFYEKCYDESQYEIMRFLVLNEIAKLEDLDCEGGSYENGDFSINDSIVLDYLFKVNQQIFR